MGAVPHEHDFGEGAHIQEKLDREMENRSQNKDVASPFGHD